MLRKRLAAGLALVVCTFAAPRYALAQDRSNARELTRTVRPWEFLPAVGTRAALLGDESGHFEAWVYPLKILRNFHLQFHVAGEVVPADSLARTVTVRPESCTILYSGTAFQVRETLFVPVREPGAIITIAVQTTTPLEVEAVFERDFTLEWPGSLGGTYLQWDGDLHAFFLTEELNRFAAFIGSPSGVYQSEEYFTNESSSSSNSFLLGVTPRGSETKTIVIAASSDGRKPAEEAYRRLLQKQDQLLAESSDYYSQYLSESIHLELPDRELQDAYDWSRVSMIQGMVSNPFVGTSLVAGYNQSHNGQRPGFAWFFGRDSLWTSLALDAAGDFASTRTVLDFLTKYQRADGKITHEVSQSATFVPWFTNYPYPYASADATPLFLIAMNDYVVHCGDVGYAEGKWPSIWSAYQFLRSTYDAQGLPQNMGIGHGWIEGGPLWPAKSELYQAALGAEALKAAANLARLTSKEDISKQLDEDYAHLRAAINQIFWSPVNHALAFALNTDGKLVDTTSVLAAVPMWFGLLDEDKAEATIDRLADYDNQADWGMRIISSGDPKYNPEGYHNGTVWPLFTGWASVGEYRYHRALPAYSNLRANALLAFSGSLGHVAEVLSGNYDSSTLGGTPDQIWSAAMVVSPLLRGLMGLTVDAVSHRVEFSPHVPADWSSFHVENIKVGSVVLDLNFERTADTITLNVVRKGDGDCTLNFAPAFSLRARLIDATVNNRKASAKSSTNSQDQHFALSFPVEEASTTVRIRVTRDFSLGIETVLPPLGMSSEGLRVVSQSWNTARDRLTLDVAGIPGNQYELPILNPGQIVRVEGATLTRRDKGETKLRIEFPSSEDRTYKHTQVAIYFVKAKASLNERHDHH